MQMAAEARELKERLSRADKEREQERERGESLLVVLEQLRVSGAPVLARLCDSGVSRAWRSEPVTCSDVGSRACARGTAALASYERTASGVSSFRMRARWTRVGG